MANRVEQTMTDLLQPIIEERGDLLWDVTFAKEGSSKVLRILVDKPNHERIDMQELTALTEAFNELLDTVDPDPIPEAYMLDVSSPGAERPLTAYWQYQWAHEVDEWIQVSLFAPQAGQKKWQGKITQLTETGFTLVTEDHQLPLAFDDIAKANLAVQIF
jgi:ribosome maturation factor RimP